MIKGVEPEGEKSQKTVSGNYSLKNSKCPDRYYRAKLERRRNKSARWGWGQSSAELDNWGGFRGQLIHLRQEMTVVLKASLTVLMGRSDDAHTDPK